MAFSLSRNAKLYLSTVESSWDGDASTHSFADANTFEIPILDGFSFTQATGTQVVTLNESGASPSRGQRAFNTSLEAVEWSFSTYLRPYTDGDDSDAHGAIEKILWNALVSDTLDTAQDGTNGIACDSTDMTVSLGDSNKNQLLELYGYFHFSDSNLTYKLSKMCVDSVTIDFDIDGIAMANWTGYATAITQVGATYPDTSGTDYVPFASTSDFILNRLSTVTLTSDISGSSKVYTFPITGGSWTFSNNISYTIPEELGVINDPIDHQTGTRAISGSLTAYLDDTSLETKEIYDDIYADINGASPDVTNTFNTVLKIGGASAPYVELNMPYCHLELPAIETADVMGVTINYTVLESALGSDNEMTVNYVGLTSI